MKVRLRLGVFLATAALATGCVSADRYRDLEARHAELRARFDVAEQGIAATEARNEQLRAERDGFRDRFAELSNVYERVNGRNEVLEDMVAMLRHASSCLRTLQLEIDRLSRPGSTPTPPETLE